MNELGLWFQPQHVKSLEFIALILITTKNKLDKLKISDFSWTHQRTDTTSKIWRKDHPRKMSLLCLPEGEAIGAIKR